MTYTCTYTDVQTPEKAAEMLMKNAVCIYNKSSGVILIPDLVDGAGREGEEYGFRIENGDWMYGIMSAVIPPDTAKSLVSDGEGLGIYAVDTIPAAGTCALNRMEEYGADCDEELIELLRDIFGEEPPEWTAESITWSYR